MRKRRLQWFGHVCWKDEEADIRRAMEIQVGGKRKRGRPNLCWKDTIKTVMEWCGLEKEDTDDRDRWRCLVEMKIRQKPATRKDRSGESIIKEPIPPSPCLLLLNDTSSLKLTINNRRLLLAGLTAAKKMIVCRWKPPHTLSMRKWLASYRDIVQLELSTAHKDTEQAMMSKTINRKKEEREKMKGEDKEIQNSRRQVKLQEMHGKREKKTAEKYKED
ncbi:unnamed protein product [Leuciscus chuanchicus]